MDTTFSLLAAGAESPRAPALVVDGTVLTYGDLASRVRRVMSWFLAHGVDAAGREDKAPPRVALVGANRVDTLLALYALLELGVTAVLVHPRLTARERRGLIRDARPVLVVDEEWREPEAGSTAWEGAPAPVPEESCLAILYTSGTTGRPKGALLARRALSASARASAQNLGWRPGDRWWLSLPVAHVGGLSIVTRCLAARACVVLETLDRFDARAVTRVVEERAVTLFSLVPTMLQRLLALDPPWDPPPAVRAILLGGAAVPPGLLDQVAHRGWPVLTTYGLTEAASQVTTQRLGTVNRGEAGAGEPLPGMEVRVVDGVVEIRGPCLMSGYFPPREHPSPWTRDGWFRTGDLGYLDEARRLHLRGRRQDLIVSGGENVYPLEVEQFLEEHPGISQACVFGQEDDTWGEVVAAVLQPSTAGAPSDADLAHYCRQGLAPFKRPRSVAWLDELPTTSSGKLDRQATRKAAEALLKPLGCQG